MPIVWNVSMPLSGQKWNSMDSRQHRIACHSRVSSTPRCVSVLETETLPPLLSLSGKFLKNGVCLFSSPRLSSMSQTPSPQVSPEKFPVGQRVSLPGHFLEAVTLEGIRFIGSGYECRVRLVDGTPDEAILSLEE